MKTQIVALLAVVLLASWALAAEEGTTSDVMVEEIEPFYYAAVEMTGNYDQHEQAFQTLYGQLSVQGITQQDAPFGIYYDDPSQVPVDSLKWEIGIALPAEKELKEPLTLKKWEYPTLVTMDYEGPFSDEAMGAMYGKIFGWMESNNYSAAGPIMEKYMSEMTQNADGQWIGKIKMMVPATKN